MKRGCVLIVSMSLARVFMVPSAFGQAHSPKEVSLWEKLRARIENVDKGLDGVLGVFIKDLKSAKTLEMRPHEVFPQASSIKVAVLYELYRQADEGKLDLQETIRPRVPRVGGSGILQFLGEGVRLTWRDLAILMIGLSDNEATNRLIDKVGLESVNRRLDGIGAPSTRLARKMMDVEAAKAGRENVSTPLEMARLMEAIYEGRGLSPVFAKDIRAVAATPKDSAFREPLPDGLAILDKPGSLGGVRSVVAVVDVPGRPYIATIMTTYLRRDRDGEAAIREISAALFETFDRLAKSSDLGRVVK